MKLAQTFVARSCLTLLALAAPAAAAAESGSAGQATAGPNVKVTILVGDIEDREGTVERSYSLIARAGGPPARMMVGWRTPIPTTSAADGAAPPVTSYVYQNVGMSARVEVGLTADGSVLLTGAVEISGARPHSPGAAAAAPGSMPIIGTFQQDLSVALRDGQPLRVAEVPDPEGGTKYLQLTAEVLD